MACCSKRARGDALGEVDRTVFGGVLLDQVLEARDHRDRAREGLGQSEGPLDLLLGCCPYDLEGRHGDGVVLEEVVAGGLRLDIEHRQQLRVDAVDVVALVEGVHHHFPVAVQRLADVHHRRHQFQVVRGQDRHRVLTDPLRQRLGVGVRVDEDEAPEGVHRNLDQRVVALVEAARTLLAQQSLEPAVEVVGPQVVLAQESALGVAGAALADRIAAVPAGVDEAAQLLVLAPHDEEGLVVDLVFLPVADLGQVVDAACDLPRLHPDRLALALGVLPRAVTVGGDSRLVTCPPSRRDPGRGRPIRRGVRLSS